MSEMSYLEKLLDGVEVEWKTLGSIAGLKRGTSITKKDVIDGTIPVVAGGRTPAYYHNTSNRDGQTIVIAGSGAYAGFVSWWEEPIFVSDAFTVKPHNILLPRYCYHFLMNMQQQLHEFKSGGGVPHVYPRDVSPILIPIPCPDNPEKSLAIQSEIVRILDKFTAITAELTAELNMRKKQYNYYRDQLLSFKEGEVEWKALEEVSDIYDSLHQTPQYSKNGLSMIRVTDIKNGYIDLKNTLKVNDGIFSIFTKKYLPQKNDLVMSRVGSYGNVGIIPTDNSACMGQNTVVIHPHINNRYLFYILTSSIGQDFIEKNVGGGSQKTLSLKSIKSIPIPLTGESEQSKIVSILDKFDTLTTSISEGLPREIELRQKQYEYYRDLLFSFPKPDAVSN
ncbi:restriction endonuclease subunit S [Klebsiella pneumoniae]|uniref:restriction endonuclease subunit S n=1 Tax=Klebsiella pneumoniae TaxID=573 RepID=UPI0023818BAE|nr:restriction endonuclease subunit S [Klebsiella pneumoniae]MDE4693313.1 restriction endonuclease subunit S [Klebsiella pneumoniae]